MNYKKRPGLKNEVIGEVINSVKPTISIITPFYNSGLTITETATSVFNQTYPFFEWIIVDDGSKDEKSLKLLKTLEKKDKRIKVYHQKNGGPSIARDYGISKSSKDSKYIFFLDSDDVIDRTMLECMYWSLETHPETSFAYTSVVNFEGQESIWDKYFTVEEEKYNNLLTVSAMVKKDDLLGVGCFGIKEKAMYEDWNLWLKLIAAGKKPLRINAPLLWYRITKTGEFSQAKNNNDAAMYYINETNKKINGEIETVQFPRTGGNYAVVRKLPKMVLPDYQKDKRITILYIFPWMVVGGADYFNLELVKRLDNKKYRNIILTTTPNDNLLRQEFEDYAEVYDMSTFVERADYIHFTEYIISSRKVDIVFVSNSEYGYYMVPYLKSKHPTIPFIDYIHCVDITDDRKGFVKCSRDVKKYLSGTYCCNNATLREMNEDFGIENAETIYIGTDEKKFDPAKYDKKTLREKYHLPQDKIIISMIARMADQKRPEMFVEIAKRVNKKMKNTYFVIVGDGPLMPKVKALVNSNFKLMGEIKEPIEFYALSDLTVNCSMFEGLALTSYESLSMGVPVVSTDAGGQPELINDDVGAIVHFNENSTKEIYEKEINEYVEQIIRVVNNLEQISGNCRKRLVEGFTLDLMVKRFEQVFKKAISLPNELTTTSADYSTYELAMEVFYKQYKYYVKDVIQRKYELIYIDDDIIDKHSSMYFIKGRIGRMLQRIHVKKEAKIIETFFIKVKELFVSIINVIKYLFLSIPAGIKICYKILTRNMK